MKKIKNVLLLIVIMISLTGCVKFNASMNIKKDKSMDFEIIYAFNSSLVGDGEVLSSEDKQKMIDQGFTVTDYADDTMKGFKLVRTIKNIDEVSTTSEANYSLSGVASEGKADYLFEIKKGFLKNTYTAKLNFDASDSNLNEDMADNLTNGNDDTLTDDNSTDLDENLNQDTDINQEFDDGNTETDTDTNPDMDLSDLQEMLGTMDLSFNVNLPYKAISSNATSTANNNKNLSWKFTTDQVSVAEFTFELYNMNNIMYIGIGILVLIIIVVIVIFMKKNKKKGENDIPTVNEEPAASSENPNVTPIAAPTQAAVVPPVNPTPVPTPAQATVTPTASTTTPIVNNVEPVKPVEPVSPVAPVSPQITPVQPINPVPPVVPVQPVNPVNPSPASQEPTNPSIASTPNTASNSEVPIVNHTSLGSEPTIENSNPGLEILDAQTPTPVVPNQTNPQVMDNIQPNNNNPM